MQRSKYIVITCAIVILAFFAVHYIKDSYMILPFKDSELETPIISAGSSDKSKWKEFSSPQGHFSALFPSHPQHATDNLSDPNTKELHRYDTFLAGDESGSAFMISAITYPSAVDAANTEQVLQDVVKDILIRNKENTLKSMKIGNYGDLKALDFTIANGDVLIKGKVFAKGNKVYVLSMLNKSDSFNGQDLDYFLNSFKLLNSEAIQSKK